MHSGLIGENFYQVVSFKHKLMKSGFCFLISLNSGKYLPACLIIQIGFILVSLLIITLFNGDILIINYIKF